ncbi:MAG: hypothetical protein ACK47J_10195 [Pseudanabaena sp.]
MVSNLKYLIDTTLYVIKREKLSRSIEYVSDEYTDGWNAYYEYLSKSNTLDEWLYVDYVENQERFYNIDGKLKYTKFDSGLFYKTKLYENILSHFPNVTSITEYGCGLGRNLLYLKSKCPNVSFYGYELCLPGVEIANLAAQKFGLDVKYSQLDYINSNPNDYIFPVTDIAFTMFSLEQVTASQKSQVALTNILSHVNFGSIHIEPVPENYPFSFRGCLGRLEHWKVDYLQGFHKNVEFLSKSQLLKSYHQETLLTAHNPLMFPSIYILKKNNNH